MQQLTIYDFLGKTNPANDEVFEIIKRYLKNHGKNNEYFIYKFEHYSQLLKEKTKIAFSCIAFDLCDAHLLTNDSIYNIRLFKSNCIIEEEVKDSPNFNVIYELMFKNYNEQRQTKRMKEFLDWFSEV